MKKIYPLLITVFIGFSAFSQQSVELKLKLEKNKPYALSSVSEQTVVQTVNGIQQTIESSSNYNISMKMLDQTSSFMVLEIHFDTIFSTTNTMGKLMKMGSASEGDIKSKEVSDIMSYIMNRISKNPLYVKIDFGGKVIEVVNMKMISEMILKDTASISLTGPTAAAIKSQIINMVNEDSFKSIIELFTRYLPAKLVSTGEKWTINSITHAGGMDLEVATDCQLQKLTDRNALLDVQSSIGAAANSVPMQMGGLKISYDELKGNGKSSISLDLNSGLVSEGNSKAHISGNLGVNGPGVNMQIPIDITSNSKIVSLQ